MGKGIIRICLAVTKCVVTYMPLMTTHELSSTVTALVNRAYNPKIASSPLDIPATVVTRNPY